MDAASTWLSRELMEKIRDEEAVLVGALITGGAEERYQNICGQLSSLRKIAEWVKNADPDERPASRQNLTQEVY